MSKKKAKTAKELDERFDNEDVTEIVDEERVTRKVLVDFPLWMLRALDEEASRLSVPRQAVIKNWLNDRIEANKRTDRRLA